MKPYTETKERRQEIAKSYPGVLGKDLSRMFLTYDRYHEAGHIIRALDAEGIDWSKTEVVDFGCGPGDYGFALGRQGAGVVFYDYDQVMHFVNHRLSQEENVFGHMTMPKSAAPELIPPPCGSDTVGVAIFGEVLEHTDNPMEILSRFHVAGVQYIFTSSYPYRRDNADDDYWRGHTDHSDMARLQQPMCREFLERNYKKIGNFGGQANLWKRR